MKHVIFLAIFMASVISLNSQTVNKKQWTLIHERTADWCPFCGTWGWDLKTKLIDTFNTKDVIFMAIHHSGGLNNPTATAVGSNFTGDGQPRFYIDGTDMNATSGNVNAKVEEAKLIVDFNSFLAPFAGVGINAELSKTNQNTLKVDAVVEFLSDIEGGDYYLGLYLLEDVIHMQAAKGNSELHKSVLRSSLLPTAFGNPLIKGAVAKGAKFNLSVSVPNITPDRSKLKVVGIIWNKSATNGKYLFFNANQVSVGIPASNNDVLSKLNDMKVYQSESGNIIVDLSIEQFIKNATLTVTDISGKLITSKRLESLSPGAQKISLEANFNSGVHIVSLQEGKNIVSKKLIIQ
jgi:hypothetical protein